MKWTDEVIEGAPYITTPETLDQYKCDFAVHGNDKTTCKGEDTYNSVKKAERYKEVERTGWFFFNYLPNNCSWSKSLEPTAGISTTGLINRILQHSAEIGDINYSEAIVSQYTGRSPFLQTSRKIYEFVNETSNPPKPNDKIVYVAGTFDLFHVGQLDFLQKAKSLGDYLLVGLYGDDAGSKLNCSILNLNERMMNLLSCKYVNEVLIDAPRKVSANLMDHFNVGMVYHGRFSSSSNDSDPYEVPKKMGKFDNIDSGSDVTTDTIIERIKKYDEQYRITNRMKEENEMKHQDC